MTYYILQYPSGDYLYVMSSSYDNPNCETYPCELHQATLFKTKEEAVKYIKGKIQLRKVTMEMVDD